MTALEVARVVDALEAAGCPVWLEGGWGVDTLAARRTRAHRDLDIAVDAMQEGAVLAGLEDLGYAVETDRRPTRVELAAPGRGLGRRPPRGVRPRRRRRADRPPGRALRLPGRLLVTGSVAGRTVGCICAVQQIAWRAGYELCAVDRHDPAVLHRLVAGQSDVS